MSGRAAETGRDSMSTPHLSPPGLGPLLCKADLDSGPGIGPPSAAPQPGARMDRTGVGCGHRHVSTTLTSGWRSHNRNEHTHALGDGGLRGVLFPNVNQTLSGIHLEHKLPGTV